MMLSVEQSVELIAGETEVLGENLPTCRFVHHKSQMTWPGFEADVVWCSEMLPKLYKRRRCAVMLDTAIHAGNMICNSIIIVA
jgi:hypothetical protein